MSGPTALLEGDLAHLRACVTLAREALEAGDEPFGSLLVDGAGVVRRRERNRVGSGDHTLHPEVLLARWAVDALTPAERAASTVFTSGEHCAMCAAAHGWVGLGPIAYAASAASLTAWQAGWGAAPSPVAPLPIGTVVPELPVRGPAPELQDEVRELHHRAHLRS